MNYPIAIVGPSGSGKSYSLRNLDPANTVILNIERKPLPFKSKFDSASNIYLVDANAFDIELKRQLARPEIAVIVIESLTKYLELMLAMSRNINTGWDIYSFYNKRIGKFVDMIKDCPHPKYIVVLAIDELVKIPLPSGSEAASRRIAVSGKEWEGKIEKEFTVVLTMDNKIGKAGSEYRFLTNNDGTHTAKSPPAMFSGPAIDNDVAAVIAAMEEFNKS